jgi:hypothetical protein
MKTAAHYRALAEECIKWAGEAYTAEVRESYLALARIWLDSASRLNGLSPSEQAVEELAQQPPAPAAQAAD